MFCKHCRYWEGNSNGEMSKTTHQYCLHPKLHLADSEPDNDSAQSLFIKNGLTHIITGPDFGCIHFEKYKQ